MEIMKAWAIIVQAQARPNCSTEREGKYDFPPLAEAVLTIHGYWKRENQFSLRVLALASRSCSTGRPQIQEYMGSETELEKWEKKKWGHGIV